MFADSPSSENPNSFYGDTTKTTSYHHDHHQEHQNIYHHHDQTHLVNQIGSLGTGQHGDGTVNSYPSQNSSGLGEFSIYPELEQHLNTFNQDHLKELQSANFGYISFSWWFYQDKGWFISLSHLYILIIYIPYICVKTFWWF